MPCGLIQNIAFAAWVLLPPLIPARAYRHALMERGDVAGLLPIWHPRIWLGGVFWMRGAARTLPPKDPPRRLLRKGRLIDVKEPPKMLPSPFELRFWGASLVLFAVMVWALAYCRPAS